MQLGVSTITSFLEFWLGDMVELPFCWPAEKAVTILLIPLLFSSAIFSIVGGHFSDKLKKRKPLVIGSCKIMCLLFSDLAILMAACTIILSGLRGGYAYLASIIVAVIIGIGFGSYSAIDFALVIDVLGKRKSKAKDLAVWHQALILPQCIAAPIGGLILDIFQAIDCRNGTGYIILFLTTSFYFFLGGILVMKIKDIK